MIHQCDNCTGIVADCGIKPLHEIEDLVQRLTPGSPTPSGECLACGAFTYPVEESKGAFCVKVRVDVTYPTERKLEDVMEEVCSEMHYNMDYDSHGVCIENTEIYDSWLIGED